MKIVNPRYKVQFSSAKMLRFAPKRVLLSTVLRALQGLWEDLKSCEHCARIGSSPIPGTEPDFSNKFRESGFFIFPKPFDISAI